MADTLTLPTWEQSTGGARTAYVNCGNYAQAVVTHEVGHLLGLAHPHSEGANYSPMGAGYFWHNTVGVAECQYSVCTQPTADDHALIDRLAEHDHANPPPGNSNPNAPVADPTPLPRQDEGAPLADDDIKKTPKDGKWHAITENTGKVKLRAAEVRWVENNTLLEVRELIPAAKPTGKYSDLEDIPPGYWRDVERERRGLK